MRDITEIIIHCAATPPGMDIGVEEIRHWHADPRPQGNGWSDIGYHFVIRRDGRREKGRALEIAGAHARGHNASSIGVCLVGGVKAGNAQKADCNFTAAQWPALHRLVSELTKKFPVAKVIGHRDVSKKDCPGFDVGAWWYGDLP